MESYQLFIYVLLIFFSDSANFDNHWQNVPATPNKWTSFTLYDVFICNKMQREKSDKNSKSQEKFFDIDYSIISVTYTFFLHHYILKITTAKIKEVCHK